MSMENELDALVDKIKSSRKYSNTYEDTIRDVMEKALAQHRRQKDAIKAAKTKLHRIQAAYLGNIHFEDDLNILAELYTNGDMEKVKNICLKLMQEHASTKERTSILDSFYEEIFSVTGIPSRILDIASGIHPLSIPWMGLSDDTVYRAYEIDNGLVNCLNRFFEIIGYKPLARLQDVICTPPTETGDLAFVMKMIPCLERREKGCSIRLLRDLKVRYIVVSFPIKSLSGRSKHMPSFYTEFFNDMVDGCGWQTTKLPISEELVFIIDKEH